MAFLSHTDDDSDSAPNETRLSKTKISNVQLKPLYGIFPQLTSHGLVEGTFMFETPIFLGKGYVLLNAQAAEGSDWKAFSLYVAAAELKGHGTPIGYYDNHAKTWQGYEDPVQLYLAGNKYLIDIGAADYVINGQIKTKSGEPERFTENGLVFKDGSFLEADAVVFATGYYPVKHALLPIFGEEISERISPAWEMIRNYRPCGHPGLWWAAGGFDAGRCYSKSLALQIKGRELGMVKDYYVCSLRSDVEIDYYLGASVA